LPSNILIISIISLGIGILIGTIYTMKQTHKKTYETFLKKYTDNDYNLLQKIINNELNNFETFENVDSPLKEKILEKICKETATLNANDPKNVLITNLENIIAANIFEMCQKTWEINPKKYLDEVIKMNNKFTEENKE